MKNKQEGLLVSNLNGTGSGQIQHAGHTLSTTLHLQRHHQGIYKAAHQGMHPQAVLKKPQALYSEKPMVGNLFYNVDKSIIGATINDNAMIRSNINQNLQSNVNNNSYIFASDSIQYTPRQNNFNAQVSSDGFLDAYTIAHKNNNSAQPMRKSNMNMVHVQNSYYKGGGVAGPSPIIAHEQDVVINGKNQRQSHQNESHA